MQQRPDHQVSHHRTCLDRRLPNNWDGTKILQHASHTMELVMKEALCIRSMPTDSHLNKDSGYELPNCWIALNRKLKGRALTGAPHTSAGHTHTQHCVITSQAVSKHVLCATIDLVFFYANKQQLTTATTKGQN